jgi:hypothetical protein
MNSTRRGYKPSARFYFQRRRRDIFVARIPKNIPSSIGAASAYVAPTELTLVFGFGAAKISPLDGAAKAVRAFLF